LSKVPEARFSRDQKQPDSFLSQSAMALSHRAPVAF
jgi:hypothetical protein